MNPIQEMVVNFQELAAQVPEILRPFIVMLAGAVPFIEGEGASVIGLVGGLNPIVAGIAAAAGNFLSVLLVVLFASRTRTAVVKHNRGRAAARNAALVPGPAGYGGSPMLEETPPARRESKGQQRFKKWLVRFGVPGASILGPLAIPTQFTSAILIASGTSRGWVLLWQAVAIILWTTVITVSVWAALTYVVGV
ncbi:small multidrug efflux protein [Arthrobacter jiangjiafuii]|uniref:Small multidrug efflux protein n=2 Tax=Arthrobacter jiangjiafuii TaxID=2817475 RepID=A0A975M866_9MICC|nr:small multidrug efflux protein [Arthrobacter jiangjiafuii]QWC11692.1 small multidrug efflux protein [Arthrobacter jiangjiafuii]